MSVSRTKIRVRYAETDQMGVVYYANYFVWFEVARVELLRQLGFDYKQMEVVDGCHIAVVDASCRYKAPARYDDEILLETSVTAMRRSVLKFAYRVLRLQPAGLDTADGASPSLLAEGETTHVVVDRQMSKAALPERYAEVIKRFMDDSSGA
jgi:acyl-CoA thioester hydrolase